MTSGSVRNQASGLSSNNPRSSLVKDFLLSGSRRLSSSALHLSVFNTSPTRSQENVTLISQKESTFTDHVPLPSTFLTNEIDPPGRLRTSSLTMDVSSHSRKDLDSGNSSLIDSSSADSYQEFGSASRSRTTSSSKSDHSLTSLNQNDYQMGCHRKRHSSVSDSNSGSSGKVSLIASDITETSEQCCESGEIRDNCAVSSKMYVCEETNDESESQPFLCLPSAGSFLSPDGDGHYKSYSDIHDSVILGGFKNDSCDYPVSKSSVDIFSPDVLKGNHNHEPFFEMKARFQSKDDYSLMRSSFVELKPLIDNYDTRFEKETCELNIICSEPYKVPPLRRSVSLSNILNPHPDNLCAPSIIETSEVTSKTSPLSDLTPKSQIFSFLTKFRPEDESVADVEEFSLINIQSNPVLKLQPFIQEDGSSQAQTSTHMQRPPVTYAHYTHPQHNIVGTSVSTSQSQQIIQEDPQDQLFFNQSCLYNTSFFQKNQNGDSPRIERTPKFHERHDSVLNHDTCQVSDFVQNSLPFSSPNSNHSDVTNHPTKFPVKNLESVLGHGTPASLNIFKSGFKSAGDTPLQVLVPRVKMTAEEINQVFFTSGILNSCFDNACLSRDLHLQQNAQTILAQATNTSCPHRNVQLATFPNTLSAVPHSASTYQSSLECSSPGFLGHYPIDAFLGVNDSGKFCRQLNQISNEDRGVLEAHGDHTEEGLAGKPDRAMFGLLCSRNVLSPGSDQHTINNMNQHNQARSHPGRGCESEPVSNQSNSVATEPSTPKVSGENLPKLSDVFRCSSQHQVYPINNPPIASQCHHFHVISPSLQVKTKMCDGHDHFTDQHSSNNLIGQPCQQCFLAKNNEKNIFGKDFPKDVEAAERAPIDDSGYHGNMVLRVPKACFVPGFLNSRHNIFESRRGSVCQSDSSSLNSEPGGENNGSIHQSNTSQQGLLKFMAVEPTHCRYLSRELPDYTYLCLVATLFNPLLGLMAFTFNHYARRSLLMRRPTHANNFYFATIVLSTVAIFLTLIGGALLIAHRMVLRSEQKELSTTSKITAECENDMRNADEEFQHFYNINADIFCKISKNQIIMEAMMGYMLNYNFIEKHHRNEAGPNLKVENASDGQKAGVNSTDKNVDFSKFESEDVSGEKVKNGTIISKENTWNEHNNKDFGLNNSEDTGAFLPLPSNGTTDNSTSEFHHPDVEGKFKGEDNIVKDDQHNAQLNKSSNAANIGSNGGMLVPYPTENATVSDEGVFVDNSTRGETEGK